MGPFLSLRALVPKDILLSLKALVLQCLYLSVMDLNP